MCRKSTYINASSCRRAVVVTLWLASLSLLGGCHRGPAESAKMTKATERVSWMKGRISGSLPSPISDAHFAEIESKIPSGHMGPGYSMWWLCAKIEIDPKDTSAWSARLKPPRNAPRWKRDGNPLHNDKNSWSMPPEDFDGAAWHDPDPLFSTGAHGGYIAGHLAINKAGTRVYVWQHWR